jgi:pilus assembly protein CpaD
MASPFHRLRILSAARPLLGSLALLVVATSAGGCWQQGPRFNAPFTLANPNERHPIQVKHGEDALDLAVSRSARGLSHAQKGQLQAFLQDYKSQSTGDRLLIRAPSGGPNETAAMRAYGDVRAEMRRARVRPADVVLEPYYAGGDPYAPLRLSYIKYVAVPPDCPDWSENLARDPQNMPSPNMGCATQRNLAAMIDKPEDLIHPRSETPRVGERRDAVWEHYVKGEPTGSKWAPENRPISEHATISDVRQQ